MVKLMYLFFLYLYFFYNGKESEIIIYFAVYSGGTVEVYKRFLKEKDIYKS